MSLRPAQALVAESSRFSLRTFFEAGPASAPAEAALEGLPMLNAPMQAPELEQSPSPPSPPSPSSRPFAGLHPNNPRPTLAPAAGPGKFTFNGMMPSTTPVQLQHKLLQQHQQAAIQSGLAKAIPAAYDANEVLRLKAQVLSLTERANQLSANLASTSESVVRGNKALTAERAQFHAKFSGLTRKLEATQSALAEAEAVPREAIKNANLLNAKILELQEENHQLAQTRAHLEAAIDTKEAELKEVAELRAASSLAVETQEALQVRCNDLMAKYATLAKQHSTALARQEELVDELEAHRVLASDANARADAAVADMEAARIQVATADHIVDTLDAKLAEVRNQATTEAPLEATTEAPLEAPLEAPVACCPKTARCEALEQVAKEARDNMHGADEHDCECLAEEHRFADAVARRARWCLMNGQDERVVVAHMYTDGPDPYLAEAQCCLEACVRHAPIEAGLPYDQSLHLVHVGAAAAGPPTATDRTNAFVQAVSADLKFHMDDSQALYKSTSSTGAALKI